MRGGEIGIDTQAWSETELSAMIDLAGWCQIGGVMMGNDMSLEREHTDVYGFVYLRTHSGSHQFIAFHRESLIYAPTTIYIYCRYSTAQVRCVISSTFSLSFLFVSLSYDPDSVLTPHFPLCPSPPLSAFYTPSSASFFSFHYYFFHFFSHPPRVSVNVFICFSN